MIDRIASICFMIICTLWRVRASDYYIEIEKINPVVSGATVHFKAKVYYGNQLAEGSFRFDWQDDTILKHWRSFETDNPYDIWTVKYPAKPCPPGPYIVQVTVYKYTLLIPWRISSQRMVFNLTETLNGNLNTVQNGTLRNEFVSNTSMVLHEIALHKSDQEYLNQSATSVLTYWFIDCNYYGMSDDYQFSYNYTEVDKEHRVEALVIASFDPLPTPPPTTTTTTTTTPPPTTTTPKTTIKPNSTTTTTTLAPSLSSTLANDIIKTKHKRNVITNFSNSTEIVAKVHGKFIPLNSTIGFNDSIQFICNNNTIVPLGPNMTYGYFTKKVSVKQPISDIVVQGSNWVQPGDLLLLSVTCKGSSTFHYCYTFKEGIYNVTHNETCVDSDVSEKCEFPVNRLFMVDSTTVHTVVVIISNEVSKEVHPVTVTVYKVTKQAQLSVVVVPVAFSLVAVVLIVFGVAYYIQNRSRFIVEVADFNFGQQYVDMEYKTFRERLRDSISNAFTRAPMPGSSEAPVWPPGRKYGSMT